MYTDPDGRLFGVDDAFLFWCAVAGAAIASYDWQQGRFKDFSKPQTWLDMAFGATIGAATGLGAGLCKWGENIF